MKKPTRGDAAERVLRTALSTLDARVKYERFMERHPTKGVVWSKSVNREWCALRRLNARAERAHRKAVEAYAVNRARREGERGRR